MPAVRNLVGAALLALGSGLAAIEAETKPLIPGSLTVHRSLLSGSSGDFLLVGQTSQPGLETMGDPLERGACFVARFSGASTLQYFRYLNRTTNCVGAALDSARGIVWMLAIPYSFTTLSESIPLTTDPAVPRYDLANSPLEPRQENSLLRLDAATGEILSVTSFPVAWFLNPTRTASPRMVLDSWGALWIAGYNEGRFPVTPGGPNPVGFGSLMKISERGDRILFACRLEGKSVGALAIDARDNVYAASGQDVYKLTSEGRVVWNTSIPGTQALALHVNDVSGVFAAGCTNSLTEFQATAGAFQSESDDTQIVRYGGRFPPYYPDRCGDGYASRLTLDGELIYSTLLGGALADYANTTWRTTMEWRLYRVTLSVPRAARRTSFGRRRHSSLPTRISHA